MTFLAIFAGLFLFTIGFVMHVIWWRVSRPQDDFRALAISFFVLPAIMTGVGACGSIPAAELELREWLSAYVLNLMVSATYIMYYPAAQAASPTMLLVLEIARASKVGATRERIRNAFDSELLCRQGIDNLVHERFADEENGKLAVAQRGAFLLRMLNTWRGILGLKYGSG